MFKWFDDIYPYYVIPFQIIIPIIVWITAEIKTRTSGKKMCRKTKPEVPTHPVLQNQIIHKSIINFFAAKAQKPC
jgi:hypothetical protein